MVELPAWALLLSFPTAAKSPSAQLMEQVAQLKSLSDTIEKLKVSSDPALPHPPNLTSEHSLKGHVPMGSAIC